MSGGAGTQLQDAGSVDKPVEQFAELKEPSVVRGNAAIHFQLVLFKDSHLADWDAHAIVAFHVLFVGSIGVIADQHDCACLPVCLGDDISVFVV